MQLAIMKLQLKYFFALSVLICVLHYSDACAVHSCKFRFTLIGESCYHFFGPVSVSWKKAQEECAKMDSSLAVLDTREKHDAVKDEILRRYTTAYHWIGLRNATPENQYLWERTGDPPTFTDWYQNQTQRKDTESCVMIAKALEWQDYACDVVPADLDKPASFICESHPYLKLGGSYYSAGVDMRVTKKAAEKKCKMAGGYLPVFDHEKKFNTFCEYMEKSDTKRKFFWLDLIRREDNAEWRWHTTKRKARFTAWGRGSPSNNGKENCTIVRTDHKPYDWTNANCDDNVGALICEYPVEMFE